MNLGDQPMFPAPENIRVGQWNFNGISYRQWLAGIAMAGTRANAQYQLNLQNSEVPRDVAIAATVRDSIALADALIAELEKTNTKTA